MEVNNIIGQFCNKTLNKNNVHRILAHSYLFYFISFLLGLFLDFLFPLKIFEKFPIVSLGIIFLVFGTFLILWAQISSHHFNKENMNKETFCNGPYRYTRTPTHFGLFFLMLGFGVITNSFFIVVFSIVSFVVTKLTFIRKEEKILAEKYSTPYLEYKKSVKL